MDKKILLPCGAISGKKVYSSRSYEQDEAKTTYPFQSVFKLINYYRLKNPARAKYFNIFESDIRAGQSRDVFEELHSHRLYATTAYVVSRALSFYPKQEQKAWYQWYIERNDRLSLDELAHEYKFSKRTLQRRFTQMRESLEAFARARDLIPPIEQ
jgi:AraC-like DNA-binding protein